MKTFITLLLVALVAVQAQPPQYGDYAVTVVDYDLPDVLDSTDPRLAIVYPIATANISDGSLPMMIYNHGCGSGGDLAYDNYVPLLTGIASFGWIILVPKSCNCGCRDGGRYFEEGLKLIEWSQTMTSDPILRLVDHSVGYAVAGHSLGGGATIESAGRAIEYNIKAAIMHHPAPKTTSDNIECPTASFTGTRDLCCGETPTERTFDAAPEPKVFAVLVNATHTEPQEDQTAWTIYTVAWAEIFVHGDRGYYYDMIYGRTNTNSLCGGFYPMATCTLFPPSSLAPPLI